MKLKSESSVILLYQYGAKALSSKLFSLSVKCFLETILLKSNKAIKISQSATDYAKAISYDMKANRRFVNGLTTLDTTLL